MSTMVLRSAAFIAVGTDNFPALSLVTHKGDRIVYLLSVRALRGIEATLPKPEARAHLRLVDVPEGGPAAPPPPLPAGTHFEQLKHSWRVAGPHGAEPPPEDPGPAWRVVGFGQANDHEGSIWATIVYERAQAPGQE